MLHARSKEPTAVSPASSQPTPKIPSNERINSIAKALSYEHADGGLSIEGTLIAFAAWNDLNMYSDPSLPNCS